MIDPKTIAAWIGVLVASGGVIAGIAKFLFWAFDEIQKRRTHEGFSAPKKTLQLATKTEGNCWWHMGKIGDDPTMQVVGRMFVTNVASIPVRIPQVELRYGFMGRKHVSGMVSVSGGLHDNMYGLYDIAPNETRNVSFDFWVYPPVTEPNKPFTAKSVHFFDQFGNRHIVKELKFSSTQPVTADQPKDPEEFPYKISDSIEKEIVSVLKAERARYEMCGRRVGGLGSVHILYQGRAMTALGGDSWTPDSPANQLIVPDPDNAEIKSDNLEAVVRFYDGLGSEDERKRFVTALLERLDEKKGYLGVSYFIVCVLWRVGQLREALQKAKQDLPRRESKVYGLSNILMLINGLLKYRYSDFTSGMLDEIEQFIDGLTEHPFLIPAKIATIRAGRLSTRAQTL